MQRKERWGRKNTDLLVVRGVEGEISVLEISTDRMHQIGLHSMV